MTQTTTIQAQKVTLTTMETGVATYYGPGFDGRRTASGETFDMNGLTTAASEAYLFGTTLLVTNLSNGRQVQVRVTDRGAFSSRGVLLDLSKGAFEQLAPLSQGVVKVKIQVVN